MDTVALSKNIAVVAKIMVVVVKNIAVVEKKHCSSIQSHRGSRKNIEG